MVMIVRSAGNNQNRCRDVRKGFHAAPCQHIAPDSIPPAANRMTTYQIASEFCQPWASVPNPADPAIATDQTTPNISDFNQSGIEIARNYGDECTHVNDHNCSIFPHHAHKEPQNDSNDKCKHIPRHNVEPGQPVSNQLDHSCDPFHDINAFQLLLPV